MPIIAKKRNRGDGLEKLGRFLAKISKENKPKKKPKKKDQLS